MLLFFLSLALISIIMVFIIMFTDLIKSKHNTIIVLFLLSLFYTFGMASATIWIKGLS